MSIFKETFKDFVFRQLRMREAIVQTGNDGGTRFGNPRTQIQIGTNFENINIAKGAFYTNSISKQCVVRMTSGVDTSKFALEMGLDEDEIARNFILEGGILQENGQPKEGFAKENGAYGDKFTRSESDYDFGIVPMPGIIDANIRTKTAYGSLREAQVNFVCHNRRQLDVLEILYMRPGMPILLEWQWSPYINKEGNIDKTLYNIDFFDTSKTINDLNLEIINNKDKSDGNYDGFIGFCKNFEIVSRPDGGFDCVTEIIAIGEVLESLKSRNDSLYQNEELEGVALDNMQLLLEGFLELSELYSNGFDLQNIQTNKTLLDRPLAREIIRNDIKISDDDLKFAAAAKSGRNVDEKKNLNYKDNQEKLTNYFESIKNFFLFDDEKIGEFKVFNPFNRDATNAYKANDTFVRWDYFCDKMNEYIFPLYDPTDTKNTLLKWSYTRPKVEGKYDKVVNVNRELVNEEYIELVRYKIPSNNPTLRKVDNRNKDSKKRTFEGDSTEKGLFVDISNLNKEDGETYIDTIHNIIDVESIMNNSFNPKVCLLPRQTNKNPKAFEIEKNIGFAREEPDYIGHIMLNVSYLLTTYNKMAYSNDKPKEDFNLFDYFKKIWDDVNTACLGHHNFTLNVENERTDRIRIIDLQVNPPVITSGDLIPGREKIYEFKIQSNQSIVRDFNFNTTIPSSLSATIAIASQAPTSIEDLDQVTFKNFTKDIKSRFTTNVEKSLSINSGTTESPPELYTKDLLKYYVNASKLCLEVAKINNGAYNQNGKINDKSFIKARALVGSIDNLIPSLLIRDPQSGLRKDKIPSELSAIIPLKFNVVMDGISGIVIGNVFKVEKDKLPIGYQGDDVCFIVMGESQTITSGQDWTTELSGMLTLLNLENPTNEEGDPIENENINFTFGSSGAPVSRTEEEIVTQTSPTTTSGNVVPQGTNIVD